MPKAKKPKKKLKLAIKKPIKRDIKKSFTIKQAPKKTYFKEISKELFIAEEQVLFEFFDLELKKRHFYSIASIIFTLSLGLFFIKKLKTNAQELPILLVFALFLISIAIISLIIRYRMKKYNEPISIFEISKRVIPLYTIALLFVVVYFILNFVISNNFLAIREVIFLLSLATIFETITFHIH